jgi:hypothetical protein
MSDPDDYHTFSERPVAEALEHAEQPVRRTSAGRVAVCLLGTVVVPALVMAVHLFITRRYMTLRGHFADTEFLVLCPILGAVFLGFLPFSWRARVIAIVFYLPVMGYLLLAFQLFFVALLVGE